MSIHIYYRRIVPSYLRTAVHQFRSAVMLKGWRAHKRHGHIALSKGIGTIQDLYYWTTESGYDTIVPVHNFYSFLFPDRETATRFTIHIYDNTGRTIQTKTSDLRAFEMMPLSVSELLSDCLASAYGSLMVNISIPELVLSAAAQTREGYYFWDRFYICYTSEHGYASYVHGVDKTFVFYPDGRRQRFYLSHGRHRWTPEIGIDFHGYSLAEVIMLNRADEDIDMALHVYDRNNEVQQSLIRIPSLGTGKFKLHQHDFDHAALPLRLLVDGMSTLYGRPVIAKHLADGAITFMHS